jgi:hypothetical protein
LISAVNLTCPSTTSLLGLRNHRFRQRAAEEAAVTRCIFTTGVRPQVNVSHYIGGPWNSEHIHWCIVTFGAITSSPETWTGP